MDFIREAQGKARRLTNTQEKLPNINAKFFLEKILRSFGFRLPPNPPKNAREKNNNEKIWLRFAYYYQKTYSRSSGQSPSVNTDDPVLGAVATAVGGWFADVEIPQCLSDGVFPSNSIKSVSLRL